MPLLAIAKIVHDDDMTEHLGWSEGLRVIDTETEEFRDLSYDIIRKGAQRGIRIANLRTTRDEVDVLYENADMGSRIEFPTIKVTALGEQSLLRDSNKRPGIDHAGKYVFILSMGSCQGTRTFKPILYRVCNGFGREIKQVLKEEFKPATVFNVASDMTGFVGISFREPADIYNIFHREAREYMIRSNMLGTTTLVMADNLDGGVTLIGIFKGAGKDIDIPDYVTKIHRDALLSPYRFGIIQVGSGVKEIQACTFMKVAAKEIRIKEGVKQIEDRAFSNCIVDKLVISKGVRLEQNALNGIICKELVLMTEYVYESIRDKYEVVAFALRNARVDKIMIHRRTLESLVRCYLKVRFSWREIKRVLKWDRITVDENEDGNRDDKQTSGKYSSVIDMVNHVIYNENNMEDVERLWILSSEQLKRLIVSIFEALYKGNNLDYAEVISVMEGEE